MASKSATTAPATERHTLQLGAKDNQLLYNLVARTGSKKVATIRLALKLLNFIYESKDKKESLQIKDADGKVREIILADLL